MSFREMAASIAAEGRNGDKHLLHITDDELQNLLDTGMATRNPKTGLYEASFWTKMRDAVESAGSLIGNYFYPGSGMVTSQMTSKGSQEQLGSNLGRVAMLGSGVSGGVAGNMSNYGATWDAVTGGAPSGGSLEAPAWYKQGLADGSIAQGTPIDAAASQTGNVVEAGQWSGPVDEFGQPIADQTSLGLDPLTMGEAAGALPGSMAGDVTGGVAQNGALTSPVPQSAPSVSGLTPTASPTNAGGFSQFLKENKNLIIPGVAMGASMLTKPSIPNLGDIQGLAGSAAGAANALIPSVMTGNLPPGASTLVSNAVNDATQSIKSKYAQMGMSGSTMEAQELSAAEARGESMKFDLANKLTQTGLAAGGLATGDYQAIMNVILGQDSNLQNALANFASSSALGAGLAAKKA